AWPQNAFPGSKPSKITSCASTLCPGWLCLHSKKSPSRRGKPPDAQVGSTAFARTHYCLSASSPGAPTNRFDHRHFGWSSFTMSVDCGATIAARSLSPFGERVGVRGYRTTAPAYWQSGVLLSKGWKLGGELLFSLLSKIKFAGSALAATR